MRYVLYVLLATLCGCPFQKAGDTDAFTTEDIERAMLLFRQRRPDIDESRMRDILIATTPGGVRYVVLAAGWGVKIRTGQIAMVHYVAKLRDGTPIVNTRQEGKPIAFDLGLLPEKGGPQRMFAGMHELVDGMYVGETRKGLIPSSLAYGREGSMGVPPYSDLVIEIELIGVQ